MAQRRALRAVLGMKSETIVKEVHTPLSLRFYSDWTTFIRTEAQTRQAFLTSLVVDILNPLAALRVSTVL